MAKNIIGDPWRDADDDMPSYSNSARAASAHTYDTTSLMNVSNSSWTGGYVEPTQTARHLEKLAAAQQMVSERRVPAQVPAKPKQPIQEPAFMRRLVQVFIVDPSESVPDADCVLHRGEIVMTSATDQELFYDLDIKAILAMHNAKRVKLRDKAVKDREQMLEPARIRDLKFHVSELAKF